MKQVFVVCANEKRTEFRLVKEGSLNTTNLLILEPIASFKASSDASARWSFDKVRAQVLQLSCHDFSEIRWQFYEQEDL